MFSPPVDQVEKTRIFARREGTRQLLAYEMAFSAQDDVAMVLPLPTVRRGTASPVTFLDLSGYPELFDDLYRLVPDSAARLRRRTVGSPDRAAVLEVHRVGAFVASHVPRIADFARLDPRFRLPAAVWEALPRHYARYGFAVFVLSAPRRGQGMPRSTRKVHPMALSFETREPEQLFFPTVHLHDGTVPSYADFDHQLYWQSIDDSPEDDASYEPASSGVDCARTQGLVVGEQVVYGRSVRGGHPNRDIFVPAR